MGRRPRRDRHDGAVPTPDKPLRVVAVSHDATLTGAPVSFLRLWRAAQQTHGATVSFVVLGGGPLLPEFRRTARTLVHEPGVVRRRLARSPHVRRTMQRLFLRRALSALRPFDAIVLNTGTLGHLMPTACAAGVPVVTHVHEMRQWLTTRVPASDLRQTLEMSDALIACSDATRSALVDLGCDAGRITVVHEPVPDKVQPAEDVRPRLRAMLGVSPDTVVVAGAGTADRRKGADLFVELGVLLQDLSDRPICMPWFGDVLEHEGGWLEHDLDRASSTVRFVGAVADLPELLHGVDVFVLPSREDPFPLVMLEAAAAGVPVVAFSGSGGADEFLADGAGILSPYLNLPHMARAVAGLLDDPAAARAMGELAQAATGALTPEKIAAGALDVVARTVAGKPSRDG
jgi:glycosyltransferase involved in cell wall biosynthesis